MNRNWLLVMLCSAVLPLTVPFSVRQATAEKPDEAKEYVSLSGGYIDFEGDEAVRDGITATARIGYDLTEWLSLEGGFFVAPHLREQFYNDFSTGIPVKTSRLEDTAGAGVHSAFGTGAFADGLYHFTRWERLDPYLAAGVGLTWYSEDLGGDSANLAVRAGGGVMYHFNDEWAVRADYRAMVVNSSEVSANSMIDAGVVWYWGAGVPQKIVASGGLKDSDGDGLLDDEEAKYGTDPFDPDTDKDGLSDGDEVHKYHTDPLNPDTDYDGLKDGEEVFKYKTDPTKRDTDNGGVADGHEVIEDHTDPLNPADDLILFELYIQFDYDKAILKDRYFKDLDVIAKVLKRNPGSTARVEGHADKLKKSRAAYNKSLSQKRAESVVKYLEDHAKIEGDRLTAVGYGFDRPKAPNDPIMGNPVNRRVEVYIRGAEGEKNQTGTEKVVPAPAPVVAPVPGP